VSKNDSFSNQTGEGGGVLFGPTSSGLSQLSWEIRTPH
jgi:hypothetical protein